jgi:hypothetical protein
MPDQLQTQTMIAWYYVGVAFLLLLGQNFLLERSHAETVARLKVQYEQQLARGGVAPATETAAATVTVGPRSTPMPVPASAPAEPAAPAAVAPAKAEIATAEGQPRPAETTPIFASAAPPKASDSATARRGVPVALAFRTEPFEKGKIVMVRNQAASPLACELKVVRPSTGQSRTIPVTVAAASEARVTGGQRWTFKSGDRIEVAHAAYSSLAARVP